MLNLYTEILTENIILATKMVSDKHQKLKSVTQDYGILWDDSNNPNLGQLATHSMARLGGRSITI